VFLLFVVPYSENGQSGDSVEKESKKKKKKKNKKSGEKDQGKKEEKDEKDEKKEPQQSRTFGNGLVVEEISMGRPDGKKATPGSRVLLCFFFFKFVYFIFH
jgi:FK506-binding nuclear protein